MFKHLLDRSGLTWLTVQSHADIMLFDRITSFFFQTCEYDEATARLSFSLLRDGGWRLDFWANRAFSLCALVFRRSVSGSSSLQSFSIAEKKTNAHLFSNLQEFRVYLYLWMIYRSQNKSVTCTLQFWYLDLSQQTVCVWPSAGCSVYPLQQIPEQSDSPKLTELLWTPGQLSVDKASHTLVHFSILQVWLYISIYFLSCSLTLFWKLSSCSLYHLSFSSRLFFSSSSLFTKSISLGRKQGNVAPIRI